MARLNISPTKSNLLTLKRQLAFAQEGFDLLDQKRQILIFELMSRLQRAREAESKVAESLSRAHESMREALLEVGSESLDRASLGVKLNHEISLAPQLLMGLRIPHLQVRVEKPGLPFGIVGTSANTDVAMMRFVEALPLLAELAELENAIIRLARELRKTQRRCNALSKTFIPAHQETVSYITESLEERERESFTILKMIRNRLRSRFEGGGVPHPSPAHPPA